MTQAVKMSELDNGPVETWEFVADQHEQFLNKYLAPYLNIIKKCGLSESGCWTAGNKINRINGSTISVATLAKAALNNGMFIAVEVQDNHTHFYIDIDGAKGSNRLGRDVFRFTLTPTPLNETNYHKIDKPGFYPVGTGLDRDTIISAGPGCSKTSEGQTCGALIVLDGWQIKDDYPW